MRGSESHRTTGFLPQTLEDTLHYWVLLTYATNSEGLFEQVGFPSVRLAFRPNKMENHRNPETHCFEIFIIGYF